MKDFFQGSAVQASAKIEKKGKQKLFMNLIGQSLSFVSAFWTVSHVVVATVLPKDKIVQKMPGCGSLGPNFDKPPEQYWLI